MSMKMINLDNSGPLLDRHEELVRDSVANCDWTMEKQLEFEMQHRFVRVHSLELIG